MPFQDYLRRYCYIAIYMHTQFQINQGGSNPPSQWVIATCSSEILGKCQERYMAYRGHCLSAVAALIPLASHTSGSVSSPSGCSLVFNAACTLKYSPRTPSPTAGAKTVLLKYCVSHPAMRFSCASGKARDSLYS